MRAHEEGALLEPRHLEKGTTRLSPVSAPTSRLEELNGRAKRGNPNRYRDQLWSTSPGMTSAKGVPPVLTPSEPPVTESCSTPPALSRNLPRDGYAHGHDGARGGENVSLSPPSAPFAGSLPWDFSTCVRDAGYPRRRERQAAAVSLGSAHYPSEKAGFGTACRYMFPRLASKKGSPRGEAQTPGVLRIRTLGMRVCGHRLSVPRIRGESKVVGTPHECSELKTTADAPSEGQGQLSNKIPRHNLPRKEAH